MAYCEYCGEALSNSASYCPKCGANILFTLNSQSSSINDAETTKSAVTSSTRNVTSLGSTSKHLNDVMKQKNSNHKLFNKSMGSKLGLSSTSARSRGSNRYVCLSNSRQLLNKFKISNTTTNGVKFKKINIHNKSVCPCKDVKK